MRGRKTFPPFKKPCKRCDKTFSPSTRASHICDECKKKARILGTEKWKKTKLLMKNQKN